MNKGECAQPSVDTFIQENSPQNRLQKHFMKQRKGGKCESFVCKKKTESSHRTGKQIPDSLVPPSRRTNQSSLTCVYVSGRLSSRIRFPNCGFVSGMAILVLTTADGAVTSTGYWRRSGRATNANTQQGIILEIMHKLLGHLHLQ